MSCKVSVIVPVYNCKKYLETAIRSVIEQTLFNETELILVDDGSTDGSGEICDKFASEYPNIFAVHQNNSGVSVARNTGMEAAKGEYIAFLDSDDSYEKNFIQTMLENSEYDLVCCDFYCNSKDEKNVGKYFENKTYFRNDFTIDFYRKTIRQEFYSCWNKLYKKSIISENNIKFTPGVRYAEDMTFVMEYLKFCESFRFVSTPLYYYNVNPGNTTSVVKNGFDVQLYIYNYHTEYFKALGADPKIFDNINDNFVYKTTCTINSMITYSSFKEAYKYVKKVLDTVFFDVYRQMGFSNFKCVYDKVFYRLLSNKRAFLIVLWRKLFDLRSKF